MIYDVIVVGAGPGGSSAASFVARGGASVLLLDKADFPRDKVCGDGLMPQAIYWLDLLGCAEEVLATTRSCIRDWDLFVNHKHLLTARLPDGTLYPDFTILLDRRRLDHILLRNAVARGARFEPRSRVRDLVVESDCVRVTADVEDRAVERRGRIVIGADGVSSVVSRLIGNKLRDGVTCLSVRTYYHGANPAGARAKVYFDRDYFPGYGWLLVDDEGVANVGLGYAFDQNFPLPFQLKKEFERFVATDLGGFLRGAERCGPVSGGAASFYRPRRIFDDRVMLVGDAANQTDPMNGGGIHKAIEGGYYAAQAALRAVESGDFSRATLGAYKRWWDERSERDWMTAEAVVTIIKNPALRDFWLYVIEQIGRLSISDRQFREFCAGVFAGMYSQSMVVSPRAVYRALPKGAAAWLSLLRSERGAAAGSVGFAYTALASLARAGARMLKAPLPQVEWGVEVARKLSLLAARQV